MSRAALAFFVLASLAPMAGCVKRDPKNPKVTLANVRSLEPRMRTQDIITALGEPLPQDKGLFELDSAGLYLQVWRYRGPEGDAYLVINNDALALVKMHDDYVQLQPRY